MEAEDVQLEVLNVDDAAENSTAAADATEVQQNDVETGFIEEEKDLEAMEEDEELEEDISMTYGELAFEYLPWFLVAGVGIILLIVAVILLLVGTGPKKRLQLDQLNIPSLQGSMKVQSIGGEELRYTRQLKYIGNLEARNLRHKIEPKLVNIYKAAKLEVDGVLVLAFKYGGAGDTLDKDMTGRSSGSSDSSIVVRHWIYLKTNTTLSMDALTAKVKTAVAAEPGISIDQNSISLLELTNMTRVQALTVLSQHGFFKRGMRHLDMELLAMLGLIGGPSNFGIQSEDDEGVCPALPPSNGITVSPSTCHTSTDTFLGMVCAFECSPTYYLDGSSHRICLSSGQWSGSPASCKPNCPPITLASKGSMEPQSCSSTNATVGQLCFVQCPSTYLLHTSTDTVMDDATTYFRECQDDGMWTGGVGFCKARCPALKLPMNSDISSGTCNTNPVEGDTCTIECNAGYVLDGGGVEQQLSCDLDGKWNKDLSNCKKVCTSIVVSSNQAVSPSKCEDDPYEGVKCIFTCSTGYRVVGGTTRVCSSTGWSETQPTCVRSCVSLSPVQNGIVTTEEGDCFEENPLASSRCALTCDVGYVPSAADTTCDPATGAWTEGDFTCKRTCPGLPVPEHGSWMPASCSQSGHHAGSSNCTLQCTLPRQSVGAGLLVCNADGMWSDMPGSCASICSPLPAPTDGAVEPAECTGSSQSGTECHFSCNGGYSRDGDRMLTCGGDGLWSASQPTCDATQQFVITQTLFGRALCIGVGDDSMLSKPRNCSQSIEGNRWSLEGSNNLRNVYSGQCLTAVTLDPYKVQMADCDTSDTLQHFNTHHQYQITSSTGKFVTSGYHTSDMLSLVNAIHSSSDKGNWRFTNVQTQVSSSLTGARTSGACLPFVALGDMTVTGSCSSGSQAEGLQCSVGCDAGFTLSDPSQSTATCTAGAWDITPDLTCSSSTEPSPTGCPPFNANLLSGVIATSSCTSVRTPVASSCQFSCSNPSHYIDGDNSIMCNADASWSNPSGVTCKAHCPSINAPLNSHFSSANYLSCVNGMAMAGEVCAFACDEGFYMSGNSLVTCMDSGQWDAALPLCQKMCPTASMDGMLSLSGCDHMQSGDQYNAGAICSLSCPLGYAPTLNGPVECGSDGMWNVSGTLECDAACPSFMQSSDETISPSSCTAGQSVQGSTCTMTCNDGYYKVGGSLVQSIQRVCGDDHLWEGPFAVCSQACPPLSTTLVSVSGYYDPPSCSVHPQLPGSICYLKCQGLDTVQNGSSSVECAANGTWVTPPGMSQFGTCLSSCDALPLPEHATVTPQYCTEGIVEAGTECIVQCPPNMDMKGPAYRKCLGGIDFDTGSRWSASGETKCMARCPPLPLPPYTFVFPRSCAYSHKLQGDRCSFECERGMDLVGALTLHCNELGEWTEEMPICQRNCLGIQIFNGNLYCNSMSADEAIGYGHPPGSRCNFLCDEGYTSHSQNEITCLETGMWSPDPYCQIATDTFSIFQKIKEETKCLVASWNHAHVGSDWILTFVNSTDACLKEQNNAKWYWFGDNNIKHADTGLCITAELARRESLIVLQECDENSPRQHWDCDAWHPYRILLKGTQFSIDTTYVEVGPILETWTHAKSYWLTFNAELETTASLCSYRTVGICPGISIPNLVTSPGSCSSDEVQLWQKCALQCQEGTYFVGTSQSTECLPTGVWKNIEDVQCVRKCSPMSPTGGKQFSPNTCSAEEMTHHSTCAITCQDGFEMSNGETQMTFLCEDGVWTGDNVTCLPHCSSQPSPPRDGAVSCSSGTCTFSCNPGFKLTDDSTDVVKCLSGGAFNSSVNATCEADIQFMLQARSAAITSNSPTCLSLDNDDAETRKVPCNQTSSSQYWRWMNDMIQHVESGKCLLAESGDDWSKLVGSPCSASMGQSFSCTNYLHPYHIGSTDFNGFIDAGQPSADKPAVLSDGSPIASGEWIALSPDQAKTGTACSFKLTGTCPPIPVSATTLPPPSQCTIESNAGSTCQISCNVGYLTPDGSSSYSVNCGTDGLWDAPIQPCVAQSSLEGVCGHISVGAGMDVNPSTCEYSDSLYRGTTCRFSCAPGFYLEGEDVMECRSDGSWTNAGPTCKAFCPGLSAVPHATTTPAKCHGIQVGADVPCTQACDSGYSTSTPANVRTCQYDGTWSGQDIVCMKTCTVLSASPHLATDDSALVIGSSRNVLTSTGCAFNDQLPGQSCTFTCPPNYAVVDGPATVSCNDDGQWTPSVPRCVPQFHCSEASPVGVASVVYEPMKGGVAVVAGTAVFLQCSAGYTVDGDSERICTSDGTWSGGEPLVPSCEKLCPPLPSRFFASITPSVCATEYSRQGQSCLYTCTNNTQLSSGASSMTVNCNNGLWSDTLPKCVSTEASNNDDGAYYDFFMITRKPELGCLFVDKDDILTWRDGSVCDSESKTNLWRWTKNRAIVNMAESKCLQPVNVSGDDAVLGVGSCDQDHVFLCGDPDSPTLQFSLYYEDSDNKTWESYYEYELYTALPSHVAMYKVPSHLQALNRHNFITISASANDDISYSESTDKSICSYTCGARITDQVRNGHIVSPGFMHNENYPPYSNCEWTLSGYQMKITVTLMELDLEGDPQSANPCSHDCIQIYEGSGTNKAYSNHVKSFTGNDLSAYDTQHGGNIVASVTGDIFIKFKANGDGMNKGFAMTYKYEELDVPSNCGVSPANLFTAPGDESPMGRKVPSAKWPWVVSIREIAERKGKAYHKCTGVLVDQHTVVSAAHCAQFALDALNKEHGVTIGIGQSSQFAMDDELTSGRVFSLERIFVHPEYEFESRRNDIAVWKLASAVNFTGGLQPSCLPLDGFAIQNINSDCYAAGWMQIDNGVNVRDLTEYTMQVNTVSYCEEELGLKSHSGFICANHVRLDRSAAAGSGDSEPLMCKHNNRWYLAGVASYTHVGTRITRRLYTGINANRQWLEKTIYRTSVVSYKSRGVDRLRSGGASSIAADSEMWFQSH